MFLLIFSSDEGIYGYYDSHSTLLRDMPCLYWKKDSTFANSNVLKHLQNYLKKLTRFHQRHATESNKNKQTNEQNQNKMLSISQGCLFSCTATENPLLDSNCLLFGCGLSTFCSGNRLQCMVTLYSYFVLH